MTDPISDMITRIRNASDVRKDSLLLPYSKMKEAVLTTLQKEGFVAGVEKKGKGVKKVLKVELIKAVSTSVRRSKRT
jgi:small subunit ribosomal protein S8